jgi:hypothetical protein
VKPALKEFVSRYEFTDEVKDNDFEGAYLFVDSMRTLHLRRAR